MIRRFTKMKARLKKIVLTVVATELTMVFCLRSYRLLSMNATPLADAILNYATGISAGRDVCDNISIAYYHNRYKFQSSCCLNNFFASVIAGQIHEGCELARQANVSAAVILPPDLDDGGTLRLSLNTAFSMYSDDSIEELKRIARDKLNCCVMSEYDIINAGIEKVYYERNTHLRTDGPLNAWTYRNLGVPKSLYSVYDACYGDRLRGRRYMAVHTRIESDWYPYCVNRTLRPGGVNACYSPTQIAKSVSALDFESVVLLYGDVAPRFLNETPQDVWPQINPHQQSFHKSWTNSCTAAMENLSYNAVALLDFWVAIEASAFVGTHLSTFSNSVTYVREIRGKANSSYVYSCPDSAIMLRHDGGVIARNKSTDNQQCDKLAPKQKAA
ncbi:hypothetical protein MPSEU_000141100 [Mayamaea pseudoterrestris]|nr:hypothetical protein MPSEU_000141100 [Mayamaea pseudoterrestris]